MGRPTEKRYQIQLDLKILEPPDFVETVEPKLTVGHWEVVPK